MQEPQKTPKIPKIENSLDTRETQLEKRLQEEDFEEIIMKSTFEIESEKKYTEMHEKHAIFVAGVCSVLPFVLPALFVSV